MPKTHFKKLKALFAAAPVNRLMYSGGQMEVSHGASRYVWEVQPDFFHGAEALHGTAYFKLLDDAAYFASASLEETYFLVTKSFELDFLRPVEQGKLVAEGKVLEQTEQGIYTQAVIFQEQGKQVASGKGVFVRSRKLLADLYGFNKMD